MKDKLYDIAIIGAGPAGMTAAIYAARANKNIIIIDKEGFGGQAAKSPKIENYPGFASISGVDLTTSMYEQMMPYQNVEHLVEEVILLKYIHNMIILYTSENTKICCKSLIIATGCKPRELKLDTKDIYYCVTCDGPFFKDKNVIIVGSGNTGAVFALELSTYCKNVFMCDIAMEMLCEKTLAEKIIATKNIKFLPNCTVTSVKNDSDNRLQEVNISTGSKIKANAIFGALGMIPQANFAKGYVNLDSQGYIIDSNVPNIFIAGDIANKKVRQISTAVGDGTIAAVSALNYLNSKK